MRSMFRIFSLPVLLLFAAAAAGQNYPVKPVRIVIGFPPGGPNDLIARAVAPRLAENMGQPFFIENKPGGNAVIGTSFVAKSQPDGYTLLVFSSSQTINPSTRKVIPFDTLKDFVGISGLAVGQIVLAVNPGVSAQSLKDFVALAKSSPGKLNYGSTGTGSATHLGMELFNLMAGIRTVHVPYQGAGPATQDLLAGTVDALFMGVSTAVPYISAGKVRPLAMASLKRSSALPDIPSFQEEGFPKFDISSAFGLLAPSATPRLVVNRLNDGVQKVLDIGDIKQTFTKLGLEPWQLKPSELQEWLAGEVERWQHVARAINYQLE